MPVPKLDTGLVDISYVQRNDELHLPRDGILTPKFQPEPQALDKILNRPTLDERVSILVRPHSVDGDLLVPFTRSEIRVEALTVFEKESVGADSETRKVLDPVVKFLKKTEEYEFELDEAFAALHKG